MDPTTAITSATGQGLGCYAQNYAATRFLMGVVAFEWSVIAATWEIQLAAGPEGWAALGLELGIFGVTVFAWREFASGQATLCP